MKWTSYTDLAFDLGKTIRRRRSSLDLSQEHVAHEAGLSVRHFAKVEQGRSNATIATLLSIAGVLGLDFDQLVSLTAANAKKKLTVRRKR